MRDPNICAVCGQNPVIRYTAYAMGASCKECQQLKLDRLHLYEALINQYQQLHQRRLPDEERAKIDRQVDETYPLPKHINP